MSAARILTCLCFLLSSISCSQKEPKVTTLTSEDGTVYIVTNKQKIVLDNEKMFVITYISLDPHNVDIRTKEFQDLYQITANNIDPESDYKYVGLIALKKPNKSFGVTKNSGFRDRRLLTEVLKLRKNRP